LMDYMVELGLEGLHLDDKAFDTMNAAHFRDNKIIIKPYGFKLTGAPLGEGGLDMRRAYELIQQNPKVNRINIELDLQCPLDNMQETLRIEREALQKSVRYCRELLGV